MIHSQVTFDEFMRRVAQPLPVKDTPETRAAVQMAREELMTPGGPELIADLLEGIGRHVVLLESERGGLDGKPI